MGHPFDARLGANENIFGPSPKAIAAMQAAATGIWMYGDPENHDLRHAPADFHAVAPENIVVGEGIDGLLGTLVRLRISGSASVSFFSGTATRTMSAPAACNRLISATEASTSWVNDVVMV